MKKIMVLFTILMVLLINISVLFAQTTSKGDTLIVGPQNSSGEYQGALNEAIKADTTAGGDRAHKVYKLLNNYHYILTEVIQADFPLVIVADPSDAENRPPIIRCGLREDGSPVNRWWVLFNDATFKNIWMSGINVDGNGPIDWISQEVNTSNKRIIYQGCIIEFPYTWWATFADWGSNNTYIMENCISQYVGNPTGATWNGAVFSGGTMDSVIQRNCTFFDFGCYAYNGQAYYLEFDHNTYVNCMMHPIMNHAHIKAIYTNNLFVNCHAFSDDYDEITRHHDAEVKGLMNYAESTWDKTVLDSLYGPGGAYEKNYDPNGDGELTEGELVWELKNNVWWYTQPIKDYWDMFDAVVENPWMNNYNIAMFQSADSTEEWTWDLKKYIWADSNGVIVPNPTSFDTLHIVDSTVVQETHEPFVYFLEENTQNVDPGIVYMNGTDELMAQNCINIRTEWGGGTPGDPVNWHGVDSYLAFTWPLNYDLSYTNADLYTAGTDGLPIGSSQWWLITAIEDRNTAMPTTLVLMQNYPNPFNPATTIKYSLSRKSDVKLKVYNVLGAEVASLVNKSQGAGEHEIIFNAKNLSSGVYFYQLKAANQVITKKMMLLK
ncbi:MAG: T9SS type A sorting domain-containing protein [Calditrichaceae bacterium]|nr:T9SS type A sorting domain-containing protein [Calditrichaceae bacterium]